MKIHHLTLVVCLSALGACTAHENSAPAAPAPAPAQESSLLAPADAAIPTEQEAADAAAKTIDEKNADAEFEKLKQEIQGGH
jgi:hypothetical protein